MTAEELKTLHEEYRRAVEATRAPESEEAAEKSAAALIDLRRKLDEALIEKEAEREDEQRAAAVEARLHAAKIVSAVAPGPSKGDLPMDEIRAFANGDKHQVSFTLQPDYEKRVNLTTAAASAYGSYLVDQSWVNDVTMFAVAQSGILKAGPKIIRTANGNQLNFPLLTTDFAAALGAEGTASSSVYPVFGTLALNAYRIDGWVPISDEMLRDDIVGLPGVLAELAGRAIGIKQAGYLADVDLGDGSSKPHAITIHSILGCTAVSQTAPTVDEVFTLYYSLLPQYRMNAAFVGNSTITLQMALAKDDEGRYLWTPALSANEPDRLLGKPWYEDAYMDVSTTGNIPLVCFDPSCYVVRYAGGTEVSFSRDFAFSSFETTMRFAIWMDSNCLDTAGVHHLILA